MSSIDPSLRDNWHVTSFSNVVNKISTNKKKVKQKEYLESGLIPVIDQGQEIIGGYTNDQSMRLDCNLPALVFGDHTRIVKLIHFPFAPGADGVKVLVPKKVIDPRLLTFFTQVLVKKIPNKGYARHFQHLEKSQIPLPPLPEQRMIVDKIESLFSELDNAVDNIKTAMRKLKVYRQAVLQQAFTGELTKKWREEHPDLPTAEELLEKINSEREEHYQNQLRDWKQAVKDWEEAGKKGKKPSRPQKPAEVEPLSEEELEALPALPGGWLFVRHLEVAQINPPKPSGIDDKEMVTFLPMALVRAETGHYSLSDERPYGKVKKGFTSFLEGDVIVAKITPCFENGKFAYLKKLVNGKGFGSTEFHVSRPNKFLDGEFLFHFLSQATFRKISKLNMTGSAGQLRIPTKYFSNIILPICSLEEQRQIVVEVERRLSVCDKVEGELEAALKRSGALRRSILKRAFEGRLLNERELEEARRAPDWEPAEELLRRLAAESK